MIGMIRRYLIGRARIIAKRQLAQGAKKVAQSVKDRKLLKTKAKSQILAFIISISLITPPYTFATGAAIVHDPTTFAQIYANAMDAIEKYNTMIKNMQDTLDTMNRINDVMNTASNQLNNLQTGLADPRQLVSRFESNIKNIEDNAKRIAKNLEEKDWANAFHKKEYASCKNKWANLKKEYAEWEKKKAKDNYESAVKSGDGSEESEQEISEAQQKYAKSQQANEIEKGFEYIDTVDSQGLQAATNLMHEWANKAQEYVDVKNYGALNIESAMRPKDRYTYQKKLCSLVDKEMAKLDELTSLDCYNKAIKEKNRKEADRCFRELKEKREKNRQNKINKKYNAIEQRTNSNIFKIQSESIDKPELHIDAKSGNLSGDWKKKIGKDKREEVADNPTINIGNGDNQSTMTIWIVKQDIIKELFDRGEYAEALNLQNQRNMALAMGSDTYALTQAQAETLTMISKQIVTLNDSINAIGQIAETLILDEKEAEQSNLKSLELEKTRNELKKFSVDDEVRHWEYNEYGIPVFKNRNFEKSEGILGL